MRNGKCCPTIVVDNQKFHLEGFESNDGAIFVARRLSGALQIDYKCIDVQQPTAETFKASFYRENVKRGFSLNQLVNDSIDKVLKGIRDQMSLEDSDRLQISRNVKDNDYSIFMKDLLIGTLSVKIDDKITVNFQPIAE